MKQIIPTAAAPKPAGPYSPVVAFGDLLFVSGQGPVDPSTGTLQHGDVQFESRLVLDNVKNILEDVGSSLRHVLKVTAYLDDLNNFEAFNEVYNEYFSQEPPARTCIQAGALPFGIKVEIDVIACRNKA